MGLAKLLVLLLRNTNLHKAALLNNKAIELSQCREWPPLKLCQLPISKDSS